MTKLSAKEQDLLQRVDEKEDLRPLFFRKVKGLKWFDTLFERDYFSPEANPKPEPSKEEGYVNIPLWPAIGYLVKTAPELSKSANREYANKFLEILVNTTCYAKEHDFSNYRTWWQFSQIISQIPYEVISRDKVDIVDYWLDDKYERGLVAQEIGEVWLPKLLETNDNHGLQLSSKLLTFLYKVVFVERKIGESVERESSFRFKYWHAQKITEKVAHLAGVKLGSEAILIFDSQLKFILDELKNDAWSYIWQPAIGEHEQNKYKDDAENILVEAYRDSLIGYMVTMPEEACEYLTDMLGENYQTIQRLAIHALSQNFHLCQNLLDPILEAKYLNSNFRYEMWHFLNRNYQQLRDDQQRRVLNLIENITSKDEEGNVQEGASAYNRAIWLAAIKNQGEDLAKLYKNYVSIANAEPDHPDFASYLTSGWVVHESPISIEELRALSIDELAQTLSSYKDPGHLRQPGIEGLAKTFNQLVKAEPLRFYNELTKFAELDLAYINEIINAYSDLWADKEKLPWNDIWQRLLCFCSAVINQDRFWDPKNTEQREPFVANRYWIVSGIGRLLEAGIKSDDHAFNEEYLLEAEEIIVLLLNKEKGNEYKINSDAVSISINSPRGRCLEALINLTLRSCRLSDKKNNKNHTDVWKRFQPIYDAELKRADIPEYEFATLVTNYLPNFLYMSKEWVLANLGKIFDQDHYLKWLCAMQGYAYVGTVYKEIYQYLKEHGDFIKALDDKNIKDQAREKFIQNITIAYIDGFENYSDTDSLISILISRRDYKELGNLIWFIWTLRQKVDENFRSKVFELWPKIFEIIDSNAREGKKIASQLCLWATFIDQVDDEKRDLLLSIVPFADETYNADNLLKCIANISHAQAFEAHTIWMKLLERSSSDFPEEAVRKILMNLVSEGPEGARKAKEIVSEYLKKGNERPSAWLREIKMES